MPRAERRKHLLSVARDIIREDGIGGLTMQALAERSGASKPVVYEHFENSESVAVALLEARFEGAIKFVTDRAEQAETIDQYMSIVIDSLFEFNVRDSLVLRKITNGFSSSSVVNAVYLRHQREAVAVYVDLLRQQGAPGNVSLIAGYGLFEMVNSVVSEFAGQPNNSIARDTLKQMVRGAIHSLVAQPAARPHTPPAILGYRAGQSRRRKSAPDAL